AHPVYRLCTSTLLQPSTLASTARSGTLPPKREAAERPAGDRPQADARAADLRLAGPDEPRQADDLARADRQGDIAHHAARRQTLHRQELALGTVVDPREERLDLPPGHQLDELLGRRVLHVERRDAVAVPEHGDAVADPMDLVHPMGDVDDAHALPLDILDELEEALRLALGQRRCRLV